MGDSPATLPLVTLRRLVHMDDVCWLGDLTTTGEVICKMLELPWRNNAISRSCIPTGLYEATPYVSSRFGECFAFSNQQTAPRTHIRIHAGNTHRDTSGCLIPGMKHGCIGGDNTPAVLSSRAALAKLRERFPDGMLLHITEPFGA